MLWFGGYNPLTKQMASALTPAYFQASVPNRMTDERVLFILRGRGRAEGAE